MTMTALLGHSSEILSFTGKVAQEQAEECKTHSFEREELAYLTITACSHPGTDHMEPDDKAENAQRREEFYHSSVPRGMCIVKEGTRWSMKRPLPAYPGSTGTRLGTGLYYLPFSRVGSSSWGEGNFTV